MVHHAVHAHISVNRYTSDFLAKLRRPNYVTPRHYLDALETYVNLLSERRLYIESQVYSIIFIAVKEINTLSIVFLTKIIKIFI